MRVNPEEIKEMSLEMLASLVDNHIVHFQEITKILKEAGEEEKINQLSDMVMERIFNKWKQYENV